MIQKALARGALTETLRRLCRIAIALELYQREHGSYPTALAELPQSAPLDLIDPFSQSEFRYRLKEDGSPLLWSIGINRIDEEGLPGHHTRNGDIVWQLTPQPGLTEADLKSRRKMHQVK